MAINNITQTISTLPPAGSRGVDVQTQFVIKQEDFQDHLQGTTVTELNTLKDQFNSRISEINSTATTMNGYANTASAGASTATTKAGEASTSASDALSYKNQAETFKNNASNSATKASQWADNNYNVEVETGKYSAKHWSTVAQNATANKIDKVASTDNAIVRFDGVTGQVQNSSVIIDDNGNVGIGKTPSYKLDVAMPSDGTIGVLLRSLGATNNPLLSFSVNESTKVSTIQASGSTSGILALAVDNTERMRIDSAGNVGIGVTPSAWGGNKPIQVGYIGIQNDIGNNVGSFMNNTYYDGANHRYIQSLTATRYSQYNGDHQWQTAPSGTAGNAITWKTAMTLDASGRLFATSTGTGGHYLKQNSTTGNTILSIDNGAYVSLYVRESNGGTGSGSISTISVGSITTTSRSINAAGTINASGADYAEYEYSNDISISKGQIVGFKADGTLTDKYSESIRFAIKSTNPSIVGGDIWGIEEIVGKRPEQPVRKLDKTEQKLVTEATAEVLAEDGSIVTPAQEAVYETIILEAGDTDTEWEAIEAQYQTDLTDFETRLETERQKVDRIAYSGKVPVNVLKATPGDYIIVVDRDDKIDGEAISNPTFEQYLKCVGRVNKILEDGRAEVAVLIH